MDMGLRDTVALVTGAGGNIGLAICAALKREGCHVVATDVTRPDDGGDFEWHDLDVTSEAGWQGVIDGIRQRHGRLDVLVNNAGIALMNPISETSVETWDRTMAINGKGVFLGMKHAQALLAETGQSRAGGSAIVNLASGAADKPAAFSIAYCSSKAAVRMATRVAAVEYGALKLPIRVNSVHPGVVASAMMDRILERYSGITGVAAGDLRQAVLASHPMGKYVEPDEVADAVVFLASTASRHTHGASIHVDGGHAAT
ncbi:SDR family oxidoreductase [Croceicoccus ponticola]|uniref:SDR family oxidoreductase n=1 Tax=Croceicoccus ponticola TaxID=2217664 RepID=A0A437GV92_9SPHN|nr:SDR family oxidoreductase [Croceicoccus ponticola]RVQ65714.1 SDR family oxidoreductase [Croceicoccus ponticola]